MASLFEERPRKVHLYVDRTGQMYNTSGKPREYAHTLCKGNFAGPGLLTSEDPRKVNCMSCRKKLLDNLLEENTMSKQEESWRGMLAEEEDEAGGALRYLNAVTDPRHREAFILRHIYNWPLKDGPDGVPTLCEKFKPVSERQIRNWINAAIEQMREAHGEES